VPTNFPTAIDAFVNPSQAGAAEFIWTDGSIRSAEQEPATILVAANVALTQTRQHTDKNDAIAALQAKVGINDSAVTTSIDYQLKAGGLRLNATNTASGVTGDQTINNPSGTVNFAATATTIVVTNSLVAATSIVLAVVRTNDTTAVIKSVVPAAGSFTIRLNAAATAETSVGFIVFNGAVAAPSSTRKIIPFGLVYLSTSPP